MEDNSTGYWLQLLDTQIYYRKFGRGPALIFAHCSGANHKQWLFAAERLSEHYTCYLPDLIGYGKSSPRVNAQGQSCQSRDVDVIAAIAAGVEGPVSLVGHSYGGAAAFYYALHHPEKVANLFLVEPAAFQFLDGPCHQQPWTEIADVARRTSLAVAQGRHRKAASIFMSYWVGPIKWLLAPRRFKQSIRRSMSKIAYECDLLFELNREADLRSLVKLNIPTQLVYGSRTRSAAQYLVCLMSELMPQSQPVQIHGAGHMSPYTHQREILNLMRFYLVNEIEYSLIEDGVVC